MPIHHQLEQPGGDGGQVPVPTWPPGPALLCRITHRVILPFIDIRFLAPEFFRAIGLTFVEPLFDLITIPSTALIRDVPALRKFTLSL